MRAKPASITSSSALRRSDSLPPTNPLGEPILMFRSINHHPLQVVSACAFVCLFAQPVLAQFDTPLSTPIRERVAGELLRTVDAPTPEPGDQLGAFFEGELVGVFTFTSQTVDNQFSLVIYGDDPATAQRDGPVPGARIEFRFFDSSTNDARTDLRPENLRGEPFNYRYGGEEVPDGFEGLPLPIDLTPTLAMNLRLGAAPLDSPESGASSMDYDVNGDGKVSTRDAALVLRIVSGASRGLSADEIRRADVNRDGVVNTNDAIEILTNR